MFIVRKLEWQDYRVLKGSQHVDSNNILFQHRHDMQTDDDRQMNKQTKLRQHASNTQCHAAKCLGYIWYTFSQQLHIKFTYKYISLHVKLLIHTSYDMANCKMTKSMCKHALTHARTPLTFHDVNFIFHFRSPLSVALDPTTALPPSVATTFPVFFLLLT